MMLGNRITSLVTLSRELSRSRVFLRPVTLSTKTYSTQSHPKTSDEVNLFKPVYKLTYIAHAKVLCRLKLYQTAIIVCLTGASIGTQTDLVLPLVLCTVSLTMLAIMGEFFRKLIGILYVNPVTSEVKISHLNFWGNRKDVIRHMNEIVPPCDIGENISDAYVKFSYVNKSLPTMYLSVKYGQILDKQLFSRVIGEEFK